MEGALTFNGTLCQKEEKPLFCKVTDHGVLLASENTQTMSTGWETLRRHVRVYELLTLRIKVKLSDFGAEITSSTM